jgi:glycosyltransferase involved in cell wall biosynthesis
MKICIDMRSPGRTGILSYANSLLTNLLSVDHNNEYIVITDPKHRGWSRRGIEEIVVPFMNPIYWLIWSNTVLPKLLDKNKVEIYHSLKHMTAFRMKAKKIITFHGGHTLYLFPEIYRWYDLMYWKSSYSAAIRKYDRVITVANAEKKYLIENVGFPENKFRVTYLAADDRFHLIKDKDKLQEIRGKFNLPDHFILYVGQLHPRKNLEGLIKGYYEAHARLKTKHKLVIIGHGNSVYSEKLINLAKELDIMDDVLFLGHVSHELPFVYNLADLFLLPSYHEGFGIVLIEAMACGVPVITSDIEDLREVVGDSAVLINPTNVSEIAGAIIQVLSSDEFRCALVNKGLERAKLFSWDRCAKETIKVYEEFFRE